MALNFSHRPIFPGGLSEDNLVAPMRIGNGFRVEGIQEKGGGDGFGKGSWHDVETCFDYGRDGCDRGTNQDSVSNDDLDCLPLDPFDMDIGTTTFKAAISGWLEDLEGDYGGGYRRDELWSRSNNYQLFAGINIFWNNAMKFHTFPDGNLHVEEKISHGPSGFGECFRREVGATSCNFASRSGCNMDDMLSFGSEYEDAGIACRSGDTDMDSENRIEKDEVSPHQEKDEVSPHQEKDEVSPHQEKDEVSPHQEKDEVSPHQEKDEVSPHQEKDDVSPHQEKDEVSPHQSLILCLGYLGVLDLLVVERVCKSLHSIARGDPLLWKSIHIDQPLNERITDDVLLQLAKRAEGNLDCLSLVECTRITDDGVRRVLEANPKLTKLSVPGCTRLSIEGIVSILKASKSVGGTQGVKHLHIGGLYGVTHQHFEELKLLLGSDNQMLQHSHKPHFYSRGNLYLSCDDDRVIDIEVCPRCENLRLVYDCPSEGCQEAEHASQCRACTLCIARCSQCGCCINDSEYEETFCLELLCSMCSKQLFKCSESPDRKDGPTHSDALHEQLELVST